MKEDTVKKIAHDIVTAQFSKVPELTEIKGELKGIDKAYRNVSDAWLTLSKLQSMLQTQGIKRKVNDKTKKDIDRLVDKVQALAQEIADYSTRMVML